MSNETLTLEPPTAIMEAKPFVIPWIKKYDLSLERPDLNVPWYNNPNLWVRNAGDGGTQFQNPIAGQDNWFYARVTNKGTTTPEMFWVTFNLIPLGVEWYYPQAFFPFINMAEGFRIKPGETQVVHALWPAATVPTAGDPHRCIMATVQSLGDSTPPNIGTGESNNLAVRNTMIQMVRPGTFLKIPFNLGNQYRELPEVFRLEVRRPERWPKAAVSLVSPDVHMDKLFKATGAPATLLRQEGEISLKDGFNLAYHQGSLAGFPVTLPARTLVPMEMHIEVPKDAKAGDVLETHLVQTNRENKVVGGFVVQVNVVAK